MLPNLILRSRQATSCCCTEPLQRLPLILRHTQAVTIQRSQVEFCFGETLAGGDLQPMQGGGVVSFGTIAHQVHVAQVSFRQSVSLTCAKLKVIERCLIVLSYSNTLEIHC